jgi:hypothetical protein
VTDEPATRELVSHNSTTEMTSTLVRDILPATVRSSKKGVFAEARVFLADNRIMVFRRNAGDVECVLDLEVTEHNAKKSESRFMGHREVIEVYTLVDSIVITPGRGCGCGTSLSWLSRPANWSKG